MKHWIINYSPKDESYEGVFFAYAANTDDALEDFYSETKKTNCTIKNIE